MTLDEQLQELRNNILRDRSDLIEGDSDSLWSDDTLLLYIKDAERRFARQTLILRDSTTPECTQVKLRTGVSQYVLHDSTVSVISARFDTDTFDLQRSGHGLLLTAQPPEILTFDPTVSYNIPPGRPLAYYTDETLVYARQGKVVLNVFPAPDTTQDGKMLHLRVVRIPLSLYDDTSMDAESEIPEGYQLDVLEWAAYRAQRGFDADAGATTEADKHKAAFESSVQDAIRELKRTMHANVTLSYGKNGFSWIR